MTGTLAELNTYIKKNLWETQDYGKSLFTILGVGIIFLSLICFLYYHFTEVYFISSLFIGSLMLINGNNWLIGIRNSILQEILSINGELEKTKYRIDSIDTILEKTQKISNLLQDLLKNQFFTRIFYSRTILEEQEKIIKHELAILINYIYDLRNDLISQLNKAPILLKDAKSELEKNIHGTTELDSISELQKARLDRQIEQFEELQRVLVKV